MELMLDSRSASLLMLSVEETEIISWVGVGAGMEALMMLGVADYSCEIEVATAAST
jgi:hypothetical protein